MLLGIKINIKQLNISHLSGCRLEMPQLDINLVVVYVRSI